MGLYNGVGDVGSPVTSGGAGSTHTHSESDVTGLTTDLSGKAASSHSHAPSDVTGTAVVTADSRLSDARTPTAHGHAPSEITGTAVVTADSRLSDARTPLTHSHAESEVTNLVTDLGNKEPANANIQVHVTSAHAPSNAQKNSDITKAEIEAKLTGEISSHIHAGGGGDGEVSVVATQDTANATTTLANATGLTLSALANSTYIIEVFLLWNASVATVGIKLSATASGTPTITAGHFITDATNGTPDSSSYNANDVVVTTSASAFTTYNSGMLHAILKTGSSASTWQLRFAAETTGTITIKAGSTLRYRKVN